MKQVKIGNLFKRKSDDDSSDERGGEKRPQLQPQPHAPQPIPTSFSAHNLPSDPADRPRITTYHPNEVDIIRREFLIQGACQPKGHEFQITMVGNKKRRFVKEWFDEYTWLEYSIKKNSVYCLCCYLFGDIVGQQGGRDVFVTGGFNIWHKKIALKIHVGDVNSYHNKARQKCENILKKNQAINEAFCKRTEVEESNYQIRLRATIDTCRFLLKNNLPFRGHDESDGSLNKGLFLEIGKHSSFPLVYKLLKLTLVLPVATASVERCFSAMKLLKTDLRNRIGDDFMNDALICTVEKSALMDVTTEQVMERFRKMGNRKG